MQHGPQAFELHLDNLIDLIARQPMEDDYVIDAVQKLRLEVFA